MYKIMIVDDEAMSANTLKKYIDTHLPSCRVVGTYRNGQEALDAFRAAPADILLADIRMPIMDGLQLVEHLNELTRDYIPIIISSYGEFEYAKTAMKLGVIYYLLKPLDFAELNRSVEAAAHLLSQRRLAQSSLSVQDDDQEIFLMNLMHGKYQSDDEAIQQFGSLGFPFSYRQCCGVRVRVSFSENSAWVYGDDALYTATQNLLRSAYAQAYILPLSRKHHRCDFLIICSEPTSFDFSPLVAEGKRVLETDTTVQELFRFRSLEQLRTQDAAPDSHPLTDTQDSAEIAATIHKAIEYINAHYGEDLAREDVAAKVYMSCAHFSRCFKIVTGSTYKDYLTEVRMQKAIELLKTNAKVSDIAQKVGYSNSNRFNVNFRNYTSYSPTEYRSRVLHLL